MKALMVIMTVSLILLSPALACNQNENCRFRAGMFVSRAADVIPFTASLVVNGVKCVTRAITSVGTDLPSHASHTPRMAVKASGMSAAQAKATANEGMNGFSILSSFLLRIAYSSFSALVSGILRS